MKYILGLLFNFKKYRKNSYVRIFSNGRLIDEITLDKDIYNKTIFKDEQFPINSLSDAHWLNKGHCKYPTSPYGLDGYGPLYWKMFIDTTQTYVENASKIHKQETILRILEMKKQEDGTLWPVTEHPRPAPHKDAYRPKIKERKYMYPKKIFCYEIDEDVLNDNIEIQVKNDDNNYTNGFLTNSATIRFDTIFLMPKHFLNHDFVTRVFPRLHKNWLTAYRWQYKQIIGNFAKKDTWPNADGCAIVKGPGYDAKKHAGAISNITLGGDLQITLPIIKKHGIKLFARKGIANGRFLFDSEIINVIKHFDLINTVNEDQRSDNT